MKKIIVFTIGAPGSGKSTWAEQEAKKPGVVVVTMDDLRSMIVGGKYRYSKQRESTISDLQISNVLTLMSNDSVSKIIIADTNLNEGRRNRIQERCIQHAKILGCGVEFEYKPFPCSWVELEKRNRTRGEKAVPIDVLRSFHTKMGFYMGTLKLYEPNDKLPKAIIFDIDGTIAKMYGRSPYDLEKCGEDKPNKWVVDILKMYNKLNYRIVLLSGRHAGNHDDENKFRKITEEWLYDNEIPYNDLFMRRWNDVRKDDIVKQEILFNEVAPKYNVVCAFDDRNQVVEMWRRIGIPCAQVDFGDF